jgi:hypothetical protein
MPFSRNQRVSNSSRRDRSLKSQLAQIRKQSEVMCALVPISMHVPPRTIDPPVTRTIRLLVKLTNAIPTYPLTNNALAVQDGLDYLGTSTLRFSTMRVKTFKVWMELPPNSLTLGTPSLIVTDQATLAQFRDTGTLGQSYAKVGYQYSLIPRSTYVVCTDTTVLTTVDSSQSVTTGQQVNLTIDVQVEMR